MSVFGLKNEKNYKILLRDCICGEYNTTQIRPNICGSALPLFLASRCDFCIKYFIVLYHREAMRL